MGTNFQAPKTSTKENDGEKEFRWYLEELQQAGWIKQFTREAETFKVMDSFQHLREIHHKTKENALESFNLLQGINYTYDFRIIWNDCSLNIFTELYSKEGHFRFGKPPFVSHRIEIGGRMEIVSYVDVKPHANAMARSGGKSASYYTFPFVQKILMFFHGLYINKIIPSPASKKDGVNTCLFATTFTPNRYVFTDGGKQFRKLHHRNVTLKSFTSRKKLVIDQLIKDIEKKESNNNQIGLF